VPVRLAWFAPRPAPVLLELGRTHHLDWFDAPRAHDFVWQHARAPYDLTLFELADTPAHDYVWAYLFHDPGILIMRATSLQQSRTTSLARQRRLYDLRTERAFSGPALLRAPLAASRLVVVHDTAAADALRELDPDLAIRVLPLGAAPLATNPRQGEVQFRSCSSDPEVVARAAVRAREAGAHIETAAGLDDAADGDVAIVLEWPPTGAPPLEALRAMGAGLPTIVFETEAVAAWPTIDPQSWQRRGYISTGAPIAVSIDPRDEEHSLMLAMKRLSADAALRAELGANAACWTAVHANITQAAAAWERALHVAVNARPASPAADLPAHLTADGTARARALLGEMGVSVDFLEP
jgi:hypothetical protein